VIQIIAGDCRSVLATLPAESVHCCVTSPPYFGLRDYGIAEQIGLEATPEAFVAELVAVFREVRRVLRDDGTLWLNLGDGYAGSTMTGGNAGINASGGADGFKQRRQFARKNETPGLKAKDLIGIPWRVAFALQADGWYLRQDIIWSKLNPMPESVQDRCTKAHEYLFLLSKSPTYFCDMAAIAEPSVDPVGSAKRYESAFGGEKARAPVGDAGIDTRTRPEGMREFDGTRNKRSVWTVATQPFKEAHFATFPPDLIVDCIKAGAPAQCCETCGAAWERVEERTPMVLDRSDRTHDRGQTRASGTMLEAPTRVTLGFAPSCACPVNTGTGRGVVLDPFGGAGTTGLVADREQRDAILIELNPTYAAMAEARIRGDAPLFADLLTIHAAREVDVA
jgi:DNA modification methylase